MSVTPAFSGRRAVAAALAKAEAFLLEPVEAVSRPAAITLRPVVSAVALAPGCGTSTVARALAVELAARDPAGAAAVAGARDRSPLAPGGAPARRLAKAVGPGAGERVRAAGRLCLVEGAEMARLADAVRHMAPLVIDVPHGEPAGVAVSLADHVLLVGSSQTEPALAAAVGASLARIGPPPVVVLSRTDAGDAGIERWSGREAALVGRSGLGARLALAGRGGRGALGDGLAEIAELCAAVRSEW
jgi:hypothetical protein